MQFLSWLLTSSADPNKYSAMVKGTAALGVAWLIQLSPITCGLHLICFDAGVLQSVVDTIGNIVFLALSLIGAFQFLFGLARKMWLNRWSAADLPPANLPS